MQLELRQKKLMMKTYSLSGEKKRATEEQKHSVFWEL